MTDEGTFWDGLQRERTRLVRNRTLEALAVGQSLVTVGGALMALR